MRMQPTKLGLLVTALVLPFSVLAPNAAKATVYTISSSATNRLAGAGQLDPGTLSGQFNYVPATGVFSSVSFNIEGVQSTDLNGSYELATFATSTSTNLYLRGITPDNSGGQSNEQAYLDIHFAAALGSASDEITLINSFDGGDPADFTTPPTAAYADPAPLPAPEPSSLILLASAIGLVGLRRWASKHAGWVATV